MQLSNLIQLDMVNGEPIIMISLIIHEREPTKATDQGLSLGKPSVMENHLK